MTTATTASPEARYREKPLSYRGRELRFMEVCGTHTAAIFQQGLRDIISPDIRLISGPGCPVCVTPVAYIDRAVALCLTPGVTVVSFGDMLKVPGTKMSLAEAKGEGGSVRLVYAPAEMLSLAQEHPERQFVMAAVGFETTAPVYALLLAEAVRLGLKNVRLLMALRRVVPILSYVCQEDNALDGFLAPGHVSTIIGTEVYKPLAERWHKPFVVGGFAAEEILLALGLLTEQAERGGAAVLNAYPAAVCTEGNRRALALLDEYFETGSAYWRGLGELTASGLYLRSEFADFDAGSRGLSDVETPGARCRCGDVILGRITPAACPLFRHECTPVRALGPCMVSAEGTCGTWFRYVESGEI
jgi:hydrogenase expression/formation protein HypD